MLHNLLSSSNYPLMLTMLRWAICSYLLPTLEYRAGDDALHRALFNGVRSSYKPFCGSSDTSCSVT